MALSKKKVWRIIRITLVIYVALGLLLYYFQDKLLFHPKPLPATYKFQSTQSFIELNIPVTKEHNLNVLRFTVDTNTRKGVVLFFHGNRENSERYLNYAPLFTQKGYEVWLMDYPGFGKTTGARTEQGIYQDALLLYKMAISIVPSEKIIIYGKSLGTGVASQLASVRDCKELILETPYYSVDALAKHYFPIYPVSLSKYEFPTFTYLKSVAAPIFIFHGTDDGVVPYSQAKRLAEENKQVRLITIEGGSHNDLMKFELFRNEVGKVLSSNTPIP